ncbi:MAG: DUF4388 domain-containing protein [Nitrospiraceae bacterium]|nr:DUF4388 domain-containing protein [Nitrospiraceae bacterium]
MAITGELEQLHIVDIIQLLNTTRKSGTFSVRGEKGESRIIFSNGCIVGASHLNNKVRIGTVLVKMRAITASDLTLALDAQKKAGKDRKPLINTLIEKGKLRREEAAKGLKKLIEIVLVEMIGWKKGTFILDSDIVLVSPECSYPLSEMEQEIGLDAQMLLMDALRIYDERERDRESGKPVSSDEELFGDVVPPEKRQEETPAHPVITADDLGLGDLDHLERKIPEVAPEDEVFDPAEIHRQKIRETLSGFPAEDQEAFVAFLERSSISRGGTAGRQRKNKQTKGILLFSEDEFITHSVMTICKAEDVLVFAADGEEEFLRIIDQCVRIHVPPVLVFDDPAKSEKIVTREKIVGLRRRAMESYPELAVIQVASTPDDGFTLLSYRDGARAVLPKPRRGEGKAASISDTIAFLEVFRSYVTALFEEQTARSADPGLQRLRESVRALGGHSKESPSLVLLGYLASVCERAITFTVRSSELTGERALGVFAEKDQGPTSVSRLGVPLKGPSVFRDAIEKGTLFYGDSEDESLKKYLFDAIGAPLSPAIVLLPVRSRGKVVMLAYGDFGMKEAPPRMPVDLLDILAAQTGLAMENAFYHAQLTKGART